MIVLWSRHSITSDWVQSEAAEAARRKALVPVRIEDVRPPLEFRRLQTADLFDWKKGLEGQHFEDCLESIELLVGKTASRQLPSLPVPQSNAQSSASRILAQTGVALSSFVGAMRAVGNVQDRPEGAPRSFLNVWYRADDHYKSSMFRFAYAAIGKLMVEDQGIVFHGMHEPLLIPYSDVATVQLEKMPRDLLSKWCCVHYGKPEKIVGFKDGRAMGWISETDGICAAIEAAIIRYRSS